MAGERYFLAREKNPSFLAREDAKVVTCSYQLRLLLNVTLTILKDSLFPKRAPFMTTAQLNPVCWRIDILWLFVRQCTKLRLWDELNWTRVLVPYPKTYSRSVDRLIYVVLLPNENIFVHLFDYNICKFKMALFIIP